MSSLWSHIGGWLARRRTRPVEASAPALVTIADPTPPLPPVRACATVVIPALNEARRIAEVVRYALGDPATAEVVVIDDSSIDETATLASSCTWIVISRDWSRVL